MRFHLLIYPAAAALLAGCAETPATRAHDCRVLASRLENFDTANWAGSEWRETESAWDATVARYRRLGCGTY